MSQLSAVQRRLAILVAAVLAATAALVGVSVTRDAAQAFNASFVTPRFDINTRDGLTRVTVNIDELIPMNPEGNIINQPLTGCLSTGTEVTLTRLSGGSEGPTTSDVICGEVIERTTDNTPASTDPGYEFVIDFDLRLANPGFYQIKLDDANTANECEAPRGCFEVLTPTGAPTATTFTPNIVSNGTTSSFSVTGTNFAKGSRVEVLKSGVVDPAFVATRSGGNLAGTTLTGSLRTDATATTGVRDIRVTNTDGRSGLCVGCLQINSILVTGVSPTTGTNQEIRRVAVTGSNFPQDAVAELVREYPTGQPPITGGNTVVAGSGRLDTDFDLRNVEPGSYLVRVRRFNGDSSPLACAPKFQVIVPGQTATPSPVGSPVQGSGTCSANSATPTPGPTTSPSGSPTPSQSATPSATSSATTSPSPMPPPGVGRYVAVNPDRALDTRQGIGSPAAKFGPGETRAFQVTGRSGVPFGATAVTFNLTVDGPTSSGFITAFPAGAQRPLASNINFSPREVIANLVTVRIGNGGQVSLFNSAGRTDLIADVVGYFDPASGGAAYSALNPERIMDSRDGVGTAQQPFGPAESRNLQITGRANVPANATAVAFNLTAIEGSAGSFLTAYPSGTVRPTASNLNFVKGDVIANLVVVRIGSGGQVTLYNQSGVVDVAADIVGYYSETGGAEATYTAVNPDRFMDTRDGTGGERRRVGPGESRTLQITGRGGVPTGALAVTFNLTAVAPSSSGFLTAYPTGTIKPIASNINFKRGDVIANQAIVRLGSGGRIDIFNNSGFLDVVVDVVGYYVAPAASATPSASATASGNTTATPTASSTASATASVTATTTATSTPSASATSPAASAVAVAGPANSSRGTLVIGLFVLLGVLTSAGVALAGPAYTRKH